MVLQARTWTEVAMNEDMISILLRNRSQYKMYFVTKETTPTGDLVNIDKIELVEGGKGVYFRYPAPLKLWVYMDAPTGVTGVLETGVEL